MKIEVKFWVVVALYLISVIVFVITKSWIVSGFVLFFGIVALKISPYKITGKVRR